MYCGENKKKSGCIFCKGATCPYMTYKTDGGVVLLQAKPRSMTPVNLN